MKKIFLAALLGSVMQSNIGLAQGFTGYTWKTDMKNDIEIPEQFKDAAAVILESENYNKSTFSGTFPFIEQLATYRTQFRVKILKEEALEEYQQINIPKFRGRIGDFVQMKIVDVRIRKADGTIKDYKVRDLPKAELTEEDDLYYQQEDFYMYQLEDLEVGDELEQINILEAKFVDQGRTVNLYADYPVLKAKFTLSAPSKVVIKGKVYNGMPDPVTKRSGDQQVYTWTMENLKALPEANSPGTIFTDKLEYLIYELNLKNFRTTAFDIKNFSDIIRQYASDLDDIRAPRKKKMDEFYAALLEGKSSKTDQLLALNEFIAKELKIISTRDLTESERSSGIDYFLMAKKADYQTLMRIYKDFFERYGIKYNLAFGRSRYQGPVDLGFPSQTQIGSYFYVINVDGRQLIISGTAGINELPNSFWGTTCFFLDVTDRSSQLQKITFPDTPLSDGTSKRNRRVQAKISLEEMTVAQKISATYLGAYSVGSRGGWVNAQKVDTLVKAVQARYKNRMRHAEVVVKDAKINKHDILPNYDFKLNVQMDMNKLIQKTEDGNYSLDFKYWLEHNVRTVVNIENRELDYHVPFIGTDVEDFFLIFDKDIEFVNQNDFMADIADENVEYQCKISQVKPNTIRIESRYKVKKLFIEKSNLESLDEANQAIKKLNEAKLIFKVK
ncbi:MAG: DUF3857 domain-containing protein [Saprospiraceae bacterium]|nr:DUF3857 domain-containing protein [Saprospiraceae bacterium]